MINSSLLTLSTKFKEDTSVLIVSLLTFPILPIRAACTGNVTDNGAYVIIKLCGCNTCENVIVLSIKLETVADPGTTFTAIILLIMFLTVTVSLYSVNSITSDTSGTKFPTPVV